MENTNFAWIGGGGGMGIQIEFGEHVKVEGVQITYI